jgi:hypothetical protein
MAVEMTKRAMITKSNAFGSLVINNGCNCWSLLWLVTPLTMVSCTHCLFILG